MIKRYVLDGPPGSGKTTLLFGASDTHEQQKEIIKPNLSNFKFECIRESAASTYFELEKKGINPAENFEFYIEKIIEKEREKYLNTNNTNKTYFFDRCFHHWLHFKETANINLPEWYSSFNSQIKYSNPIFLLSPITSFDLSKLNEGQRTRKFTLSERIESYSRTKKIYEKLGYQIVEVPVYSEKDIKENNKKRIELILKTISK